MKKRVLGGVTMMTVFAAAVLGIGCGPKATKADCEKFVDHMVDIQAGGNEEIAAAAKKASMGPERDKLIAECDGKASKAEIDCANAAKTKADIEKCAK